MSTPNNLTGKKISLTYDKVVQVPDQATGILQDGLGAQVYTNSDSIGTIKMFYPMSGVLADYFDTGTGLAVSGTPWENWAICDGQNSTPDLKGRFIVGYDSGDVDYDALGDNGGEKTHTLGVDELPSHTHTKDYGKQSITAAAGSNFNFMKFSFDNGNDGPQSDTSGATGDGQAHENRPPYYTLLYVIKIS